MLILYYMKTAYLEIYNVMWTEGGDIWVNLYIIYLAASD